MIFVSFAIRFNAGFPFASQVTSVVPIHSQSCQAVLKLGVPLAGIHSQSRKVVLTLRAPIPGIQFLIVQSNDLVGVYMRDAVEQGRLAWSSMQTQRYLPEGNNA